MTTSDSAPKDNVPSLLTADYLQIHAHVPKPLPTVCLYNELAPLGITHQSICLSATLSKVALR